MGKCRMAGNLWRTYVCFKGSNVAALFGEISVA